MSTCKNIDVTANKGDTNGGGTCHSIEYKNNNDPMKYKYTTISMPKNWEEGCVHVNTNIHMSYNPRY